MADFSMSDFSMSGASIQETLSGVTTLGVYVLIAYVGAEVVYAVVAKSSTWLKIAGKMMLTVVVACAALNGVLLSQNISATMSDVARAMGVSLPTQPVNLSFELQQIAGNWTDIEVLSNAFTAFGLYLAVFYFVAVHRWRD